MIKALLSIALMMGIVSSSFSQTTKENKQTSRKTTGTAKSEQPKATTHATVHMTKSNTDKLKKDGTTDKRLKSNKKR